MKRILLLVAVLMLSLGVAVAAQESITTVPETGVEIVWPQPVSEVWGTVSILGTVNVPDLALYFIEAIPLNDDLSIPENAPWIPISPASSVSVVNNVLAEVDTLDAPDGLYAIRVNVTTTSGENYTDVVSPLRLNNTRYEFERARILDRLGQSVQPTEVPTLGPTAETPVVDNSPRVTPSPGNNSVNVRRCDQVNNATCPVLGFLLTGEVAPALAISANGTGWFQIRLPSGLVGWVSPTVVTVLGETSSLPRVSPPAPLPMPPTAVPTSATVLNGLSIDGGTLTCGVTGTVRVNVHNPGNTNSNAGTVTVQDVALRTGSVTATSTGSFPSIAPNGNFVVVVALTVTTYFNEPHQIRAISNGQQLTLDYTLATGNCAGNPTATPPPAQPTATPTPPTTRTFQPGECTVNAQANAPLYAYPNGPVTGAIGPAGATMNVRTSTRVNGALWFELFPEDGNAAPWIPATTAPYNQDICAVY
ncbi:MAG: hypothetical protein U0452_15415 [Anaerolineae bacterium]